MQPHQPEALTRHTLDQVLQRFRNAARRLILLDYDGTLVPFTNHPRGASPDAALLAVLGKLTEDPASRVVIVSGRDKETLYEWLGHFALDFACEHGAWLKEDRAEWFSPVAGGNQWKKPVRALFETFTGRVAGAVIEEKDYSLVWHYRNVPGAAGARWAADLLDRLAPVVAHEPVEVFENDMALEVKNANANKGTAARRWLDQYRPDFVLAIGDDRTDEDTFRAVPAEAVTIKVRPGMSHARFSLPSHREVLDLLADLHPAPAPPAP